LDRESDGRAATLSNTQEAAEQFMGAMTGTSLGNFHASTMEGTVPTDARDSWTVCSHGLLSATRRAPMKR